VDVVSVPIVIDSMLSDQIIEEVELNRRNDVSG
jgi:hypothetical protein